jgi:hypothetical protein
MRLFLFVVFVVIFLRARARDCIVCNDCQCRRPNVSIIRRVAQLPPSRTTKQQAEKTKGASRHLVDQMRKHLPADTKSSAMWFYCPPAWAAAALAVGRPGPGGRFINFRYGVLDVVPVCRRGPASAVS